MAITVQHKRGTAAQVAVYNGPVAEIVMDTTNKTLVLMDGVQVGGFPLAKVSEVASAAATAASELANAATANNQLLTSTVATARGLITTEITDAIAAIPEKGIVAVSTIVTSATLTASDLSYHKVAMTAGSLSVKLPAANTMTLGAPKAYFKNTGSFPFGIRNNEGKLLATLGLDGAVFVSVDDNSDVAGSWSIVGKGTEAALSGPVYTFPTTLEIANLVSVNLDSDKTLIFPAATNGLGFSVLLLDGSNRTATTPTSITTVASRVAVSAYKISATQALIFFGANGSTIYNAAVVTVSGTAGALVLTIGTVFTVTGTYSYTDSNQNSPPKVAQLSSNVFLLSHMQTSVPSLFTMVLTVTGSTIATGTQVSTDLNSGNFGQAGFFSAYPLTATAAIVFYWGDSTRYSLCARIVTVSGSSNTVGPSANNFANRESENYAPMVVAISSTRFAIGTRLLNYGIYMSTVTISGSNVTFNPGLLLDGTKNTVPYSNSRRFPSLYMLDSTKFLVTYSVEPSYISKIYVLSLVGNSFTAGSPCTGSYSTGSSDGNGQPVGYLNNTFLTSTYRTTPVASRITVPHKVVGTEIVVGRSVATGNISAQITLPNKYLTYLSDNRLALFTPKDGQLQLVETLTLPMSSQAYDFIYVGESKAMLLMSSLGSPSTELVTIFGQIIDIEVAA